MSDRPLDEDADLRQGASAPTGLLRRALMGLADIVMPPVCLVCRAPVGGHDALCAACWRDVDFIRQPVCDRLGLPLPFDTSPFGTDTPMISAAAAADPPPYARARAVAAYSGAMRALVHGLKFHDRHDVRRLLGRWLVEAGTELVEKADVIIPVPLARRRLLLRQFNQAATLSHEVSRLTGLPYQPLALARTRATANQVGLSRQARRRNVAGAFAVPSRAQSRIEGANVLLVDDVITTGATVGACTSALLKAGAGRVDVLALALVTDHAVIPS